MGKTIRRIMKGMGFGVVLSVTLATTALASDNTKDSRMKDIIKKMRKYSGMELGNADGDYDEEVSSSVVREFFRKNLEPFTIDYDPQSYLQKLFTYFEDVVYEKNTKIQFQVQAFEQGKFRQLTEERLKDNWSLTRLGQFPALEWKEDRERTAERKLDILKKSDHLVGVHLCGKLETLKNDEKNQLFLEVLEYAIAR